MLRIAFCDDNTEFMNLLSEEVRRLFDRSVIKSYDEINYKCFDDGKKLLSYANNKAIDVVFLDIDMKGLDGFKTAKGLLEINEDTLIVFVSAYDQFVYDVFEFSPVAFVRKSFISKELTKVVQRIVNTIDESNTKIEVVTNQGRQIIKTRDIIYVNSIGNYCYIRMKDGNQFVCRDTLSNMEDLLNRKGFFRVHSAFIVNLFQIVRIEKNISVIMGKDQIAIPIAQRRNAEFKKAYSEIVVGSMI